ncbi:MAG: TlpA family protein disulfide reductase [Aristaeellaceae bacterium]
MKKLLILLACLLMLVSCAAAEQDAEVTPVPTTPPNEQGMPYLLDDYASAPVTLSDWKGTPTYLNFFTTWCTYCRGEMQDLLALQERYGEGLRVVLVHVPSGEDEATALAYLEKEGLADLAFVEDNGFFAYMYGIQGFPVSVIMDAEGYLVAYYPGAIDADTMDAAVQAAGAVPAEVDGDAH